MNRFKCDKCGKQLVITIPPYQRGNYDQCWCPEGQITKRSRNLARRYAEKLCRAKTRAEKEQVREERREAYLRLIHRGR